MNLLIEPLTRFHDRKTFRSSDDTVDLFLREKAMQDHDRELSRTNVLVEVDENPTKVIGYHTLLFTEIPQDQIPEDRPRITRNVPAILLGQIGIAQDFQGRGFGDWLLTDPQFRILEISRKVGLRAMVLDARNERLAGWYEQRGFVRPPGSLRMVKHIHDIRAFFE